VSAALSVLYADNHLLAIAKPAGLPSVADESGDADAHALAQEWVRRDKHKPGAIYLGVVHRLDRPVSGVLLFARTSKAAARLSEQFRERGVRKLYWAVALAAPSPAQGELEQWLVRDEERRITRALPSRAAAESQPPRAAGGGAARALHALTRYRTLARWSASGAAHELGAALLEFEPLTGRPHQLRVAAASLHAPLVGDLKYGAPRPLPDASVALHALRLEFDHPTLGTRLSLHAPLPASEVWRPAREHAAALERAREA
jgi:23S rRNA pseudouridine1911/1915/1917 synthase